LIAIISLLVAIKFMGQRALAYYTEKKKY